MRRLALFVLVICGVTAAACTRRSDTFTLPVSDTNVTGTFTLRTANGQVPPFTAIVTTTEQWQLTFDEIILAANNTWVDTTNYAVTSFVDGSQRTQATSSAGTYTLTNGQINFIMTTGGNAIFAGAVTGNTLSVLFNGAPYVYTR